MGKKGREKPRVGRVAAGNAGRQLRWRRGTGGGEAKVKTSSSCLDH